MEAPAVALIPPKTNHYVVNPASDKKLCYLYISIWPNGIPRQEIEGGWQRVYERMIQEYADRGFKPDGNDN